MIQTWNPKSKTEPYAHSAGELVAFAKEAIENFFEIPVNISENLFYDFVNGLENIFRDYIAFVASCGKSFSNNLCRSNLSLVLKIKTECLIFIVCRIKTELSPFTPSTNKMQP